MINFAELHHVLQHTGSDQILLSLYKKNQIIGKRLVLVSVFQDREPSIPCFISEVLAFQSTYQSGSGGGDKERPYKT